MSTERGGLVITVGSAVALLGLGLITGCGNPSSASPAYAATSVQSPQQPAVATTERGTAEQRVVDPLENGRILARNALAHLSEERWDEAIADLDAAITAHPDLAPFLEIQKIEALLATDQIDEALAAANRVIEGASDPFAVEQATLMVPALLASKNDAEALRLSLTAVKAIRVDRFNESYFVQMADALAKAGMRDEASAIRFRLLTERPHGRYTEKLYDQLTAMPSGKSPIDLLGWAESLDLAGAISRARRNSEALDLIRRIRARFPGMANDADLVWIEASTLFQNRKYQSVTRIRLQPNQRHYVSLERMRGHAYWRSGQDSQFVQVMERLIKTYPTHDEATEARLLLGKYYLTDGDDRGKAVRYIDEALKSGGDGRDGENIWTLAWSHIAAGDDDAALATMTRYLSRFPDADYTSNSLFWIGKLEEARGNTSDRNQAFERLIEFYPYNYYSYRAREILGDTDGPGSETANGLHFDAAPPDQTLGQQKFSIVRELAAVGLPAEASERLEMMIGESDDKDLQFALADFFSRNGRPLDAIRVLNRHFANFVRHGGASIHPRFWEILYPRPYWNEIQLAANESNVDPFLIAAIIRQESGFDPAAISTAGAVGLMQIMPKEASRIASLSGIRKGRVSRNELFDPAFNVRLGAAEIILKLGLTGQDEILAIAAYNAGETPVKRWAAEVSPANHDLFVDSIPYSETRLYVKNVHRYRLEYQRLYGNEKGAASVQ